MINRGAFSPTSSLSGRGLPSPGLPSPARQIRLWFFRVFQLAHRRTIASLGLRNGGCDTLYKGCHTSYTRRRGLLLSEVEYLTLCQGQCFFQGGALLDHLRKCFDLGKECTRCRSPCTRCRIPPYIGQGGAIVHLCVRIICPSPIPYSRTFRVSQKRPNMIIENRFLFENENRPDDNQNNACERLL